MEGWIKLLRRFLDWEWFQKPEMVQLFIYLLLKVNYAPTKWQGIDLKAGQVAISKSKIITETGLTEQVIKTCLKRLISTNEITVESTNRYSIITICNYDNYQFGDYIYNQQNNQPINQQPTNEQPTDNQQSTDNQPTSNQQPTNEQPTIIIRSKEREEEKEYKEKEEENILSRKLDNISSPPTGEEAFARSLAREGEVSEPEETFLKPSAPAPAAKQKPLQAKKIQEMWNSTCTGYPKIYTLSEARKNKIRIRIEEMGGEVKALPLLQSLFEKMQASNFLKGDNQRGWKASFDWLFENDKNWVKVHEGNYDKNQSGSNNQPEEPKKRDYDEKLF